MQILFVVNMDIVTIHWRVSNVPVHFYMVAFFAKNVCKQKTEFRVRGVLATSLGATAEPPELSSRPQPRPELVPKLAANLET